MVGVAVSVDNVLAGNIMSRRALYSYGLLLPHNAQGNVGNGLGVTLATGDPSIIPPTKTIVRTGDKMIIDGLEFDFLMTPGSEAPAEMHFYIPALKALLRHHAADERENGRHHR